VLPRVLWLRPLPLREEIFGAATCSSAPDLASLSRWAPALSRGSDLTSPRGELRCCHVPQRVVDHRNKERSTCPRHATGLVCVQSIVACYRDTCMAYGHAATVWFNSATLVQLTTHRHDYSCDTTRQDGTTSLTIFSIAG
jgi:hypothetical protein